MTVKEWLNRGHRIDIEINALLREQQEAFASATGAVPRAGDVKVQTSQRNSSEDRFVNYANYSAIIDKRIDELYAVKAEIVAAINCVSDGTLRQLLILRYINFETWESIAIAMHYSYMHICRLHGDALRAVGEHIKML